MHLLRRIGGHDARHLSIRVASRRSAWTVQSDPPGPLAEVCATREVALAQALDRARALARRERMAVTVTVEGSDGSIQDLIFVRTPGFAAG